MSIRERSLYERAGGFDQLLALCRRWQELCMQDALTAHPFQHPMHPQHDERLAAYLAEAFGGPKLYTAGYGDESHVQRLHAGNGIHVELDEACIAAFDRALADVGIGEQAAMEISAYFRAVTEAMRVYANGPEVVPDGLNLRHV